MIPGPLFVFAFVVSTLIGAVFHVIFGGDARRLALFLISAWIGFAIGQIMAQSLNLAIFSVSSLHIVPAAITAVACCVGMHMLTFRRS